MTRLYILKNEDRGLSYTVYFGWEKESDNPRIFIDSLAMWMRHDLFFAAVFFWMWVIALALMSCSCLVSIVV